MEKFVYMNQVLKEASNLRGLNLLYQPSINQNAMGYSLVNAPQGFVLLKKLQPICSLCFPMQLFLSEQMFIISPQP